MCLSFITKTTVVAFNLIKIGFVGMSRQKTLITKNIPQAIPAVRMIMIMITTGMTMMTGTGMIEYYKKNGNKAPAEDAQ